MGSFIVTECSMMKSSMLFKHGPLPPTSNLHPPDINPVISVPSPSPFLTVLPLPRIILNANQRAKVGKPWEWGYMQATNWAHQIFKVVTVCSPFCLLVPRLTNVAVSLKASISTTGDGNCGCDLMVARCDVYCCCDRDCTQVDIEGFQCSSTRYCVYSLVSWPLPTRCVHAGTDSMAPQF